MILALCKNTSLSATEKNGQVGVKEKILIRDQQDLGDLAEIVFLGAPYFNGCNGLVQAAVIESHRLFGIHTGLDRKMPQPTVKPEAPVI